MFGWKKERAREGYTWREREGLPERPMKIVSTRFLRVQNFLLVERLPRGWVFALGEKTVNHRKHEKKLECSNGIRKGTIWHEISISRSGDRQKICQIVEMKIKGNIFKKNLAACVVDGTHTIKTWTGLMKWNTYQGHEFEKPFASFMFLKATSVASDVYLSLLQPMKTSRYSLCSEV